MILYSKDANSQSVRQTNTHAARKIRCISKKKSILFSMENFNKEVRTSAWDGSLHSFSVFQKKRKEKNKDKWLGS